MYGTPLEVWDNGTPWRFNISVLESLSRDVFETRPATKRRKAAAFGAL